jgi:hypothetical protein
MGYGVRHASSWWSAPRVRSARGTRRPERGEEAAYRQADGEVGGQPQLLRHLLQQLRQGGRADRELRGHRHLQVRVPVQAFISILNFVMRTGVA